MRYSRGQKWTAAGVAAVLVFTVVLPVGATSPFEDVPPDHWAYAAVTRLAQLGIMEGYADGKFRGDRVLTRFELAGILSRLLDCLAAQNDLKLSPEDAALIERLRKEFAAELSLQKDKVAALEEQLRQTRQEMAKLVEQNKLLDSQLKKTIRDLNTTRSELARLSAQKSSSQETHIPRLYVISALLAVLLFLKN